MEVYDRFGTYMIHAGRADRYGGGDGESFVPGSTLRP